MGGAGQGRFTGVWAQTQALGPQEAHVGDGAEAKHGLQVAFLVFRRPAAFAGRIQASAAAGDDDGLPASQTFGARSGVAEGAVWLRQSVDPGLVLRRNAEVVEGRANDDDVCSQKLRQQALGHSILFFPNFCERLSLARAQRQGVLSKVALATRSRWVAQGLVASGAAVSGFSWGNNAWSQQLGAF